LSDLILVYKSFGKDCGFLACKDALFVFKPDKYSCATIRLENLKNNLRFMVRNKTARIVKAGATEAVVVPEKQFYNLFL
jgi:hypothetical protein